MGRWTVSSEPPCFTLCSLWDSCCPDFGAHDRSPLFLVSSFFCLSYLVLGDFLGFLSHTCCRISHPSSQGELEEKVALQYGLIHRPYGPAPLEAVSSAALGCCWPGTWTTCQALSPPRGLSSQSPVMFACPYVHSPCFSGWGMHLPSACFSALLAPGWWVGLHPTWAPQSLPTCPFHHICGLLSHKSRASWVWKPSWDNQQREN